MLKKGADPNVRSIEGLAGEILVMKTIFMLRLDLTLLILQYGPDPNPLNVRSDGRKTPVCLIGAGINLHNFDLSGYATTKITTIM